MKPIVFAMPLHLVNMSNAREHHMAKYKRESSYRGITRMATIARLRDQRLDVRALVMLDLTVTITRFGLGTRPLDDDGLSSACKGVRDGIADALGIDDGSKHLRWLYAQRRGEWGCEIRIERSATSQPPVGGP